MKIISAAYIGMGLIRDRLLHECGVAMLEMAGVMVVLMTLLIGVVGLSVFLSEAYSVNHTLDKVLVDDSLPPLLLESDGSLKVDDTAMQSYVDQLADKAENEIREGDLDGSGSQQGEERYFIEAAYAEAIIDPQNGEFVSFAASQYPYPYKYLAGRGTLVVPDEVESKADLKKAFSNTAQNNLYVLPTAGFKGGGSNDYFSRGVLVGVRIFFESKAGLTEYVMGTLGLSPIMSDVKVVSPRTQIK